MGHTAPRILAIGGGGFLMEASSSPIDDYILALTAKRRPRICFLATPSGDLPEHIEKFYATFGSDRSVPSHVAFFRKPGPGSAPLAGYQEHLMTQDVIFVGGGNTRSALGVWRAWGADGALRRAYESGVLLCGMSAGAMCWFEAGLTDSYWEEGYRPLACLGLLPGGCGVHYHADSDRRTRLLSAIEAGAIPDSIAIDDCAAALFENGSLARAVSWSPAANVYAVSLVAGRASEVAHRAIRLT